MLNFLHRGPAACEPKSLCVLGSTGSIGVQVLDVARAFPERFKIKTLAAGKNLDLLTAQIEAFRPEAVSVATPALATELRTRLPRYRGEILSGPMGLSALAEEPGTQVVIVGLVGLIGLAPSLKALRVGKTLLTANKETFVTGGHLIAPYLDRVIPIDSEHVAIHQCLHGQSVCVDNAGAKRGKKETVLLPNDAAQLVQTLYLTASGGPFRTWSHSQIDTATVDQALKHPNWVMGPKITVDSASLMNKGLEVIEAHWLFGVPYDQVQVVVHPESIVHSGVEFIDGSMLMQLGAADMHGPIQYAMTYPERLPYSHNAVRFNFRELSRLNFEQPDLHRFPCLRLGYEAGKMGGSATVVLNAADEVAVQLFLDGHIRFGDIARLIDGALEQHTRLAINPIPSLADIQQLDDWTRQTVLGLHHVMQHSPVISV